MSEHPAYRKAIEYWIEHTDEIYKLHVSNGIIDAFKAGFDFASRSEPTDKGFETQERKVCCPDCSHDNKKTWRNECWGCGTIECIHNN